VAVFVSAKPTTNSQTITKNYNAKLRKTTAHKPFSIAIASRTQQQQEISSMR